MRKTHILFGLAITLLVTALAGCRLFEDSCIKVLTRSSRFDENNRGAASTFFFYNDNTFVLNWYEEDINSKGEAYKASITAAKGTYIGDPTQDGTVDLKYTHERYWFRMDTEIEDLAESGIKSITDDNMTDLPRLNPTRTETIQIKNDTYVGIVD